MARRKQNFGKLLSGGDLRSTGKVGEAVRTVANNRALFEELLRELWNEDPRIAMRAADAVEKITRTEPTLLHPFKPELIGLAEEVAAKELKWHLAQILPRFPLTKREQHRVLRILQRYRESDSAIVRTFALQALFELSAKDAGLRRAVNEWLEQAASCGSAAERARARKLLGISNGKS